MFKPRLSLKIYVAFCLLAVIVAIGWYGAYFISVNEILTEDNTPMDGGTKSFFISVICLASLSWSVSLMTVLRQMILGYAFFIDKKGIHSTATASLFLAFIFIMPVKLIPFEAIVSLNMRDGILTARINKDKICASPLFKPFIRSEYHFFSGFTKSSASDIRAAVESFRGF